MSKAPTYRTLLLYGSPVLLYKTGLFSEVQRGATVGGRQDPSAGAREEPIPLGYSSSISTQSKVFPNKFLIIL